MHYETAECSGFYLLSALGLLVVRPGYAQDAIPVCPKPDTHSSPVYPSREMKQLMQFVAVDSPMPDVSRMLRKTN